MTNEERDALYERKVAVLEARYLRGDIDAEEYDARYADINEEFGKPMHPEVSPSVWAELTRNLR